MTYLVSNVQLSKDKWLSQDEGFNPYTNEKVWGAEHGYLQFKKTLYTQMSPSSEITRPGISLTSPPDHSAGASLAGASLEFADESPGRSGAVISFLQSASCDQPSP